MTVDAALRPGGPLVPEQLLGTPTPRPVWIVNDAKPGADLIAEVASAFAACSLVFREIDPERSVRFIRHARFLYEWMRSSTQQGSLHWRSFPGVAPLYRTQHSAGHAMLAAAWLHRLTREKQFADDAQTLHGTARVLQREPVVDWSNPLQVRPSPPPPPSTALCQRRRWHWL